jgi:hypothetical protein
MHEFQRLPRPERAQCFDHAEADPAAAVAGDAGRLVDRQQPGVLEHDAGRHRIEQALRRTAAVARLGQPHRRDPHLVATFQPGLGLGAAAVHAHLAAAHDLVDQRLGRAFELAEEEVVEPLAGTVFGHADDADAAARRVMWEGIGHPELFCYTHLAI